MGKVKSQWLEYLSEVLQLPEIELLTYSLKELNQMLKVYEDSLELKVQEQHAYMNMLFETDGWDVDVDEDGHLFIINAEGIGGVS